MDNIGCYAGQCQLVGQIIQEAIVDYQTLRYKRRKTAYQAQLFSSAKNYLFAKDGLESFLEKTGLDSAVDISSIRKFAEKEGAINAYV